VGYFRYLEAVWTPPKYDDPEAAGDDIICRFQPPAERYYNAEKYSCWSFFLVLLYLLCFYPLHHLIIPWMAWPRTLLYRFLYPQWTLGHSWSPCQAILDAFIILLSPIAVVLFLFLTTLLILTDIVAALCYRVENKWKGPEGIAEV
jgi:hypothetical protein